MKLTRKRGDTSNIFQVFIQDSSSTTGAGLTGLVFNSAGLTAYYHRDVDTAATAITLATMTVGTFTSSGFKEIDATNMPGWYQFCPPDAALAATSTPKSVGIHLKGATNMAPLPIEVQLVAVDLEDTTRLGLTALPAAVPGAAGGVFIAGTNAATTITTALTTTFTGNLTGSVASVTAGVTLAASAVQAIWDALTSALTTAGSIGKLLVDNVNATISSRMATYTQPTGFLAATFPSGTVANTTNITAGTITTVTNLTNAPTSGDLTATMKTSVTTAATAATPTAAAVTGSVGSVATGGIVAASFAAGAIDNSAIATDAIGASELAASAVTEIQSGLSTLDAAGVRSAVGLASANLDTQLTAIDDYIDTEVAAIKAKTDNLPSDPADASDIAASFSTVNGTLATIAGYIDTEVAAIKAKTDNLPASPAATSSIPTAAAIADAVWEETLTDHSGTVGSTAQALNAAGSAGDPWTTALPGSYGAGTAGKIIGDNIDAAVSSRLATAGYTAPLSAAGTRSAVGLASANLDTQLTAIDDYIDTEVAAIKAKTDNLPSDPADASDIAASFSTVNVTLATIAGYVDTEVAAIKAKTDNLPASPAATSSIPTAAVIADAVWDELVGDHSGVSGSTAEALAAAGAAGDPWTTMLPGAYGVGSAGRIIGSIPTANMAADALLDRANAVEVGVSVRHALRLFGAILGAKLSGAGSGTEVFRSAVADDKDRVTATVDSNGNRTAITYDLS